MNTPRLPLLIIFLVLPIIDIHASEQLRAAAALRKMPRQGDAQTPGSDADAKRSADALAGAQSGARAGSGAPAVAPAPADAVQPDMGAVLDGDAQTDPTLGAKGAQSIQIQQDQIPASNLAPRGDTQIVGMNLGSRFFDAAWSLVVSKRTYVDHHTKQQTLAAVYPEEAGRLSAMSAAINELIAESQKDPHKYMHRLVETLKYARRNGIELPSLSKNTARAELQKRLNEAQEGIALIDNWDHRQSPSRSNGADHKGNGAANGRSATPPALPQPQSATPAAP